MRKKSIVRWTREHFLIALNLYCKLSFGKLHKSNPLIIQVAEKMGRTPSSLAMKLCNFASLDPVQQARGVRGLTGATKGDRAIWNEFRKRGETLAPESEQLLHDLFTKDDVNEVDLISGDKVGIVRSPPIPGGPTEKASLIKVRRGQQFFRQAILNAYGVRCCISGINVPDLLVASHIKPWQGFPSERLNLRNGLCLSSLHDAAFDKGLLTLDEQFRVVLSKRLKSYLPQKSLEQNFVRFEGKGIRFPEKLAEPDHDFLTYHRSVIFNR